MAEQVLDGMEHGARVGLHRDAVLGTQHVEVERRHQGRQRGARRLVAAHLEPVGAGAQMIGVVNGPAREPQDLSLQLAQDGGTVGRAHAGDGGGVAQGCGHGRVERLREFGRFYCSRPARCF